MVIHWYFFYFYHRNFTYHILSVPLVSKSNIHKKYLYYLSIISIKCICLEIIKVFFFLLRSLKRQPYLTEFILSRYSLQKSYSLKTNFVKSLIVLNNTVFINVINLLITSSPDIQKMQ